MINKGDKAVCFLRSGTVHGKPFQEGEFLKEVWLACAPSLFEDFDNKDKIIQRIKDVPLSRNTMKDRILKLAENVTDQQKNDINSAPFISLCLDESIDITKSSRLAVFARYCVGNIIKEELIAITSLLTTTKGPDICTAVRNSLAEKEFDLKKIVSVTTDGASNMLQGPNKTDIVMMDLIRAFEAKLYVFRNDIITKHYKYFPNLKKNIKDLDAQEKRNDENVIDDFISIMDSLIKEFSVRFSQFKELSETFKFIMHPDVISFDKLNLSQFYWLEIEELEMQLIDFQSSSIWTQKFIETREKLELIKEERLTSNISKNTSNEILETWNSIPDVFNCLKKLVYAILTIFSSTYACESLFSEINNIKDSFRNRLTDDSNSACILLKKSNIL
ncbi:general transcription factor II-I repeat domain-containing protein 2A [Trichonephila clavipes]|nr:general transcription factor II-I repeat domain-containing protein 2A [Trichonephila clavipes]